MIAVFSAVYLSIEALNRYIHKRRTHITCECAFYFIGWPPIGLFRQVFGFDNFQFVSCTAGHGFLPLLVVARIVGRCRNVASVAVVEELALLLLFDVAVHVFYQQVLVELLPAFEHVLRRRDREVGQEVDCQLRILFVQQHRGSIYGRNLGFVAGVEFVDHLDNIFADQVVAQVSEVRHTVEEPEG